MGLIIGDSPNQSPAADPASSAPKTSKASVFKGVLGAVGRGAANMLVPGLGSALGGGLSSQVLGSMMPGLGSDVGQYLAMQQQMTQEQVSFETVSTVLKIRADSSMSAIRNMTLK